MQLAAEVVGEVLLKPQEAGKRGLHDVLEVDHDPLLPLDALVRVVDQGGLRHEGPRYLAGRVHAGEDAGDLRSGVFHVDDVGRDFDRLHDVEGAFFASAFSFFFAIENFFAA